MEISKNIIEKLNKKEEVTVAIHPLIQKEILPNTAYILKNSFSKDLLNAEYEITYSGGKRLSVKLFPIDVLDESKYNKDEIHVFLNDDKMHLFYTVLPTAKNEKYEYAKLKRK